MDAAIERRVELLTSSGLVNAAANRRMMRVAVEPLDVFRAYMALYAREQAFCHFSPALDRQPRAPLGCPQPPPLTSSARRASSLRALQLERLRGLVARLLDAVPVTRERLHAAGVRSAEDVRSLDDLRRLPFSMKSDLREHYPFGLLAVPREELVRVHASSGTGGKADRRRLHPARPRHLDRGDGALPGHGRACAPGMLVHNANGYGLFTGGLGFHQGAERLGATVVPGLGRLHRRARSRCCATCAPRSSSPRPSYALHIGQALADAGLGPDDLALEVGVFGGEPWTPAMGAAIERALGLAAVNMYGLSEIIGPGVAVECREVREGSHVNEDHFLAEVVDPETGEPLPDGAEGELVFSTLTKEALPLLRYRTGDIASLDPRAVRVRAHAGAHGRRARPARRHAHRPRRQPLPVRGRARPARTWRASRPHYQLVRRAPGRARRADGPLRAGRRRRRRRGSARADRPRAARAHRHQHRRRAARARRASRAARARRCAWSTGARADAFAYFRGH